MQRIGGLEAVPIATPGAVGGEVTGRLVRPRCAGSRRRRARALLHGRTLRERPMGPSMAGPPLVWNSRPKNQQALGKSDLPSIHASPKATGRARTGPARTAPLLNSKPPFGRSGAQGED